MRENYFSKTKKKSPQGHQKVHFKNLWFPLKITLICQVTLIYEIFILIPRRHFANVSPPSKRQQKNSQNENEKIMP